MKNAFLRFATLAPIPCSLFLIGCHQDKLPQPALDAVADNAPVHGDVFVESTIGDASRLNPLLATDSTSGAICNYVFNGLVKYDKDLRLVGDLAKSWEIRRGGLEILFHLRPGVRWHDGQPFTSRDVLFTYSVLVDTNVATPFGADFADVRRVEAVDGLTVRVLYRRPFAPALESWGMGMIPEHIFLTGPVNGHPANRRPVGTGPFKFVEWKADEKIILEANLDYFEGRPHFDRVVTRIIPDSSVEFLELRSESIDSMGLTPDQYQAYPEFFRRYNKFRYPAFSYTFLAFNMNHPFFKDVRVRRALGLALDKRDIIQGVLLGFGRPATGPFPPSSWAFDPTVPDTPYDPDRARALLAEAGWKDADGDGTLEKDARPFHFTVITNQGNKLRELTATILQAHLARVGVKMDIRILEWSSFLHNYVDKNNFDALVLGWNLSRDPDQYVIWHSSQRGPGKYNFAGYANPVADKLWEEARRTFDLVERRRLYHKLHRILNEDAPYLFLYYPESLPTVHKRVQGVQPAPAGIGWNFREWFVPRALQKYRLAAN